MINQTLSLRHFRSFRIPVSEKDQIRVKIEGKSRGSTKVYDCADLEVANMSLSGIAIKSRVNLSSMSDVLVHIEFKRAHFSLPGKVVRLENGPNGSEIALEFDFSERSMSAKFLESFINSFTGKRLKNHLISLLRDEESASGLQVEDIFPAVLQILEEFTSYKELPGLAESLIEATKLRFNFESIRFERSLNSPYIVYDLDARAVGSLHVTSKTGELDPLSKRGLEVLCQLLGHAYNRPECGIFEESVRFLQPKAPRKFVMIGSSEALGELRDIISKTKFNHSNIFISGDFGVGKTLMAKIIHSESMVSDQGFEILDLGQFHDAKDLLVYFEDLRKTPKGTLVLRELPLIHAELIDVLSEALACLGQKWRVITTSQLSASDLALKIAHPELLRKISEIKIEIPALTTRRGDIPELLNFFLKRECMRRGVRPKQMTKDLVNYITHMDFDLNIYDLKLFVSRMVELNLNTKVLTFEDGHRLGLLEDEHFQLAQFEKTLEKFSNEQASTELIMSKYVARCVSHALSEAGGDKEIAMRRLGVETLSELESYLEGELTRKVA